MKSITPKIVTNIEWYSATEILPPDNIHKVIIYTCTGECMTVSIYKGHFNCSTEDSLIKGYEFIPGEDVLYWAYIPKELPSPLYDWTVPNSES